MLGVNLIGVVPVLPTLTALALAIPGLLLSLLTGLAALRRPEVARRVLWLVWRQRWAFLLVLAVAAALHWAVNRGPRWTGGSRREVTAPSAAWPMDRGGLDRRGWVPREASPANGALQWTSQRSGEAFWASPAVVGDRVYCIGSRGDRSLISCWDAHTGQRLWSSAPAGYLATFSSPVISGQYLLCGEGLHDARRARVVCIDLAPPRAGRVRWTFTTNGHVECTPVVAGDRVYVGAGDDGVYCLRLDPSASDRERVVWHAPGSRYPDAETGLTVWKDRVYVGLGEGGNAICVLDAATGEELARRTMPYPVFSPPALDGDQLVVGMGRGNYVRPVEDPAGSVRCLDPVTLGERWSYRLPATVLGAVVLTSEHVVVGCCDGCVYLLDRSGRMLRQWDSGAPIIAAPAVTDRLVIAVNQDGLLVALDGRWLHPLWEARLGAPGRYYSAPVVARGHVYVGTPQDGLQCLGEAQPDTRDQVWPGRDGGAGAAGCRDGSRVPPAARIQWQFDQLENGGGELSVTASVAAAAGVVVAPIRSAAGPGLVALRSDDPGPVRPLWVRRTPTVIGGSPAIAGGRVFAVTSKSGDAARCLQAFDLHRGNELWRVPLQTLDAALTVREDCLFVHNGPGQLSCLDLEGNQRWTQQVGNLRQELDASTPILVAAAEDPPALLAIDAPSGRLLWTCSLPNPAATPPAVQGNSICYADATGVQFRSLVDGTHLASVADEVSGPLHLGPGCFAFVSRGGELVLGDPASRRIVARVPGAVAGSNPLVAFNAVLFRTSTGIQAVDFQGRNVRAYADIGLSKVTVFPVLYAGRIYLGLAGGGLVCLGGDPSP